jgi:hypothetical protein
VCLDKLVLTSRFHRRSPWGRAATIDITTDLADIRAWLAALTRL